MTVLGAVAQFERDLLIERTNAGLKRARAAGKKPGRPSALTDRKREEVRSAFAGGAKIAALARQHGTSRETIKRALREAQGA